MFYNSCPQRIFLYKIVKSEYKSISFIRAQRKRYIKNNWNLFYTLWFFLFLTFAIKIGQIWPFLFTDFRSFKITQESYGIDLPKLNEGTSLKSHRPIRVSINKDGVYKIDGNEMSFVRLNEIIKEGRNNIDSLSIPLFDEEYHMPVLFGPDVEFVLIIDRNCKMYFVNKLLYLLKENKFNKILFLVKIVEEH